MVNKSGSANWTGITGKPSLPEGFSTAKLSKYLNDNAAFHERSDLEQSLNAWNFDDGFIDIFWDQSKVNSISGDAKIITGSDGKINLLNSSTIDLGSETQTFSDSDARGLKINPNNDLIKIDIELFPSCGTITEIGITDSSGNKLTTKSVSQTGGTASIDANLSASTTYYIYVYAEGSSYTVAADDTVSFPFSSNQIDVSSGAYSILSSPTDSSSTAYCIEKITGSKAGTSGSVTHERKDLGFTPSKIVANPEYQLNSQSLELVIRDNSGNSITLQPSDFETEVNVDFADGNIQAEVLFSGDGTSTPEWFKTKFLGVV